MTEYFKLQYIMTMRKLSEGSHPIVGYLLALFISFLFVCISMLLLSHKSIYAPYIYATISLLFTLKLSEIRRNDFLKFCFGNKQYRKVRLLENFIVVLPFLIFLVYKNYFYLSIILVVTSSFIALFSFKASYNITIPTPFYKKPFEFTVGFRNTFFMFFIAYGFAIIAVKVDNFNFGVFALGVIILTILGYYLKPENEYFVWSFGCTPIKFLFMKIKTALFFSFCLCLPVISLLSVFYFEHIAVLLACTFLGFLYITTFILAKYSAYPEEIGVLQMVIFALGFFPPLLIVVIPLFASQSINKLKDLLK
ncbi:MAG: hypothetical protein FWH18_12915 [Marinilabiliaceae bacterium]|nr:hypothetical protein [Marinilabiliaceae bacterium]